MATKSDAATQGMTVTELKELRRVFNHLSNFLPKQSIYQELNPLLERQTELGNFLKNPEVLNVQDEHGDDMQAEAVSEEQAANDIKIEELQKRIQDYDNSPSAKIHAADLNEAMRILGRRCTKKEVEDMIWEVDENLDGCVDWEEFKTMFQRNITDTTGLEPFQLFNVVQFMMYDKDNSGKVTVDETMHMLYARYGKNRLESQMKALFGEDLRTADGDGELSFNEYLAAVSIRLPKQGKNKKRKGRK